MIAPIGIGGKEGLIPDAVVAEVLVAEVLIVGALVIGAGMSGGSCSIGAAVAVLPSVLYWTTLLSEAANAN